ncbi:MAG: GntR family transcriptional regulator [Rhizomicrobium sp.]
MNDGVGIARYGQLATLFRRHIATGRWKIGEQIPTIDDLAATHGVARATVRQALDILASEKLIERFRAKGTFVTHHPEEQLWCEVETDWTGLLRSRRGATIETLSEEKNQQPPLAPDFSDKRVKAYRHFRRRHWRNNEPFLISDVYIDEALCKRVPRQTIETRTGLQILNEIPGLEIGDVRQILTIGAADMVMAEMLDLELNAPIAFMRRYAQDSKGRLIFAAETIYRGDVVWLSMKLK